MVQLALLCALSLPALATAVALGRVGSSDLSLRERPVMKVVRLLQDMRAELQADLEDDKAVHEKLQCWCKENDREKTQAIAEGEANENRLTAYLGEAAAKMAEMKSKRDATLDQVNKDVAALEEANTLRMSENKDFHADEANLIEAVKACGQAITVLGKHNPEFAQIRAAAQSLQGARVLDIGRHTRSPADTLALRTFLMKAQSSSSFLAIPGYQSYAPQSGQIFGVLKQMKEDFERDLADAQGKEKKEAVDHATLQTAKKEEITAGRTLQADLDMQIATLKEKHAEAFKELEGTQAQLALDREFLANLKAKCSESSSEYDQRVKDRTEEIVAVDDTIKILNEDTAFDNFDKTVNAAFVQVASASTQGDRIQKATSLLLRKASETGAPELALLATRAQLDAFTKVIAEVDKMVAELNRQQEDEMKHRDWCVDEFAKNKRAMEEQYDNKARLQTKIEDLKKTISYLTKEIEKSTAAVAGMQKQMQRASENREAENADFQRTVTDQRLTQMILNKALARMKQVYSMLQSGEDQEPQPGAAHVHTSGTHTDPGNGPARFTKYEKHAGGSRVVSMIETVIADSRKAEDDAIVGEQDAQNAYENLMKDSNKAITTYSKKIMNMKGANARAKEDLSAAQSDLKATVAELSNLHDTDGNLHKSCDFIMDTFDARQAARTDEVEALREAKAILSGMK